jgi:ADP-heptose:LPS heptosyltransferase
MDLRSTVRGVVSAAHVQLCLRWPTLLAIAACRPIRQTPAEDVRAILLVRLDGLGDCVLTLPLVDALRRCFPSARLTVLTTPMAATIFASLAAVDDVRTMRPALSARMPKYLRGLLGAVRAWWQHLRGGQFDIVIMPRWDADIYHATLLCALSRAAVSVGYTDDTSPDKLSLNGGFERAWKHCLPAGPLQHETLRALGAMRSLGCSGGDDPMPHLPVDAAEREAARAWLGSTEGLCVVGLGLSSAETKKRWTADLFRATVQALEQTPVLPVIFADGATAVMARELHAALPGSRLAQQLPLPQVAALLAECSVFIGTDSGLGHMAAAVDCPTVTLFAQAADCRTEDGRHTNSPERFRPFGTRTAILQPEHARPGCEEGCSHTEPHCILDIQPEHAAAAAFALLHQR